MAPFSSEQKEYMKTALRLARRGWGLVSPNPMVGAVVVKDGEIIAQGWHTGPGQMHAEAMALTAAGKAAQGADLYVNLEPCNHYGRTPPCSELILKSGIARVFYANPDPNPKARGGSQRLLEAGVEVKEGLLADEAFELNRFFFKWIMTQMPYVILKTAASLDGKTATQHGESRWISSKAARNFGHHIRAGVDAVLVGRNTVEKDDPELSARPWGKRKMHRQPWRVILDPRLKLSLGCKIFNREIGGPTVMICGPDAPEDKVRKIVSLGHQVWQAPQDERGLLSVPWVLSKLGGEGCQSVLIEPGATLATTVLLEEKVVDLMHLFLAPKMIGGLKAPGILGGTGIDLLADAPQMDIIKVGRKGSDIHLILRPENSFMQLPVGSEI